MAIRTYKVTLDSKNTIAPEPVFLRQGDKTGAVVIDATLMDNGTPVSLDGLTPTFKANTADGQAVIVDSTGFNIVNASSGKFTYQVPGQLGSVPGKIRIAYFSFSDSSGAQSTFNVVFVVEKAADMTQENAKDWVSNLNEIIDQYNHWVNDAHSSWSDFVGANKEIIESIDPGGTLLTEVIDARNGKSNLKTRLDDEHAQVTEHLTELRINVKKIPKGINYEGSPLESITNEFVSQTGKIERIISYYKTVYNSGFTLYFPVGNYYFVDFPLHNEVNISGSGKRSTKFIPLENSSIDHFFYVATAPVGWCTYEDFSVIGLSNGNQNPIKNPNQSCFKMEAQYFGTTTGGVWNCVFNRIHITGFAKYGFEWISSKTTQGDMANQFNSFNEIELYRINSLESRCIKGGGNQFTYNNCMMDNELSGSGSTLGVGTNIETNGVCTFVLLTSQNSEKAIEFSTGNLTLVNPWFENVGKSITATGLDPLVNIEGGYFGNAGSMPDGSGYIFKQIGVRAIINVKGAFFVGNIDNVYIEASENKGGIYLTKCRGPQTSISRKTQQVANGDVYFGYAKTVFINSGGLIQTIPVIETEEMVTYIAFAGGVTVKTGGNINIPKDIVLNTAGDSITLVKTDKGLPYHVVSVFKQSIFI